MSETEQGSAAAEILFEKRDGVGLVTFNRPASRNAMTFAMYDGLAEICRGIEPGGDVKVLIITGAGGKAFAAGTEISAFRAFDKPADALWYESHMDGVLGDIEACKVPTIAAISGACTGGGAAIAACCDLRIATSDLKFGFPIARTLGNCLSVSNLSRLAALLGAGRTKEILFTARLIESDEALAAGLISEIHGDHDAVLARAFELAAKLQTHAPLTLAATKEGMRRLRVDGAGANDEDLITSAYMSADFREGLEAFLGKRKPRWSGK